MVTTMVTSSEGKRPVRTAAAALLPKQIAALADGAMVSDGGLAGGTGRLKFKRRGDVVDVLFIYTAPPGTEHAGQRRRMTLGAWVEQPREGMLTLRQARDVARGLQEQLERGLDPLGQRDLDRAENARRQAEALAAHEEAERLAEAERRHADEHSLGALLRAYIAWMQGAGRASWRDAERLLDLHVLGAFPDLWNTPAEAIVPEDVSRILAKLAEEGKLHTVRRVRTFLSAAYAHALGARLDPLLRGGFEGFERVKANPAAAVPIRGVMERLRPGNRVLSDDELAGYMSHIVAMPGTLGAALRLHLWSGGQRLRQMLAAEQTADSLRLLDKKGRNRAANPRVHELPLTAEIAGTLAGLEPSEDGLFGNLHPDTLTHAIAEIAAEVGVEPFTARDIRRTVETRLADMGVSKDARAQLLSHGISGVQSAHYDRSEHWGPKVHALETWADYLFRLMVGRPESNVLPMQHRRRSGVSN